MPDFRVQNFKLLSKDKGSKTQKTSSLPKLECVNDYLSIMCRKYKMDAPDPSVAKITENLCRLITELFLQNSLKSKWSNIVWSHPQLWLWCLREQPSAGKRCKNKGLWTAYFEQWNAGKLMSPRKNADFFHVWHMFLSIMMIRDFPSLTIRYGMFASKNV